MKILYGIQGTGNGHITRARHMAKAFQNYNNVEVQYFFSGRKRCAYFDMHEFAQYQTKRGLTFSTENGRINHTKTILNNNPFELLRDIHNIDVKDFDLVLNDFEPITAWAAKLKGVPSLSLSHQAAFLHHVPKTDQSLIDRAITRYFAPTQHALGTHWYHFGQHIIPPFVTPEIRKHSTHVARQKQSKPYVLVYLPFENVTLISEQLKTLSDHHFICYHPAITANRLDKNIQWQTLSIDSFKHHLYKCEGVICNSGFELSTECLSLGKPLLLKPLQKQYEQLSNAFTLQTLGLCSVTHSVNADDIDDWMQSKIGIKIDYPTNCSALTDWIIAGNWDNTQSICKELWHQVIFPPEVKVKLDSL